MRLNTKKWKFYRNVFFFSETNFSCTLKWFCFLSILSKIIHFCAHWKFISEIRAQWIVLNFKYISLIFGSLWLNFEKNDDQSFKTKHIYIYALHAKLRLITKIAENINFSFNKSERFNHSVTKIWRYGGMLCDGT